ncbi:MAG TPA: LuxR C-terminal-related transcriptional regulator [Streptosporangiaceae bacterium]|nr:LuxR C-terminal-related transcriptional regulator [Streptosporangiaceae bacterium]
MGARPSSPASPREAEVLTLLGAHLSNAEIADQLHISVRTVENHVSSLLRKYGVAGRRALATLAALTEPALEKAPDPTSPAWHTSFVGRSHERDNVLALLDTARLITLTGPGGVGKTRLASVVATAAAPWFARGAVFTDLVPARPELVIHAIATALAVTEQPGEPLDRAVLTRLGGDRLLLILDSCEHVLDAVAGFADRVLTDCPGTTILATSRERLGVPGERVVPVAPLPLASDAEELFADRALAADPAFAADPAIVAEICARLDGMPLAIELAAARCASLGAAGLLTALDDASRLLAGGRSRDERHRSLRAVIGWSHDLLDDDERALFRRLAVFASGFDIAAATAITPDGRPGPTADLIGRLADKSLVTRKEAEGSWRLMDTVRAFAADQLTASGELALVRDRHLSWAAATASTLRQRLDNQPDTRWRRDFDTVATELRDALEHCPPGRAGTPHQLARAMGYLTFARRFLTEAPGHFRDAARRAPAPLDAAADLRAAAQAVFATGLAGQAFDLLLESAKQAGDGDGKSAAIADAIVTAVRFPSGFPVQVPLERLHELLAEALLAAGAGSPAVQARLAAARAAVAAAENGHPENDQPENDQPGNEQPGNDQPKIAEEAVAAARASGDPVLLSGSLDMLSAVHARAGRLRAARQVTSERLALLDLMDRDHPYPAAEILSALHDAWLGALAVGDLPGALAMARAYGADDLLGAHPYRPASKLIPPLVLMGRFDEALGHADAMWDAWQRSGATIAVWVAPAAAAAGLALGLRGDDAGFRRWLARARRAAGPTAAGPTASDPPFTAFAAVRVAMHSGGGDPAALVADAFAPRARTWHQGYDQAAAAELAVTAGLPDAASRLAEVAAAAAESDWAAACVARASGRLHHDPAAFTEAAERWRHIDARFELACTLRLLDQGRQAERRQQPGPDEAGDLSDLRTVE